MEVDVIPRKEGLWVAHTPLELDPEKTIDTLYIQPLFQMFQRKERLSRLVEQQQEGLVIPVDLRTNTSFQRRRSTVSSKNALPTYPRGGDSNFRPYTRPSINTRTGTTVEGLSLLVDFKGDADRSARLLQAALSPLRPFLSRVDRRGVFHQGRLTVLVSGNRPSVKSLEAPNGDRFLFLDGRAKDVRTNTDTHLVPLVCRCSEYHIEL